MYIRKLGEVRGKRAAIYARISRDKKDDGDTLDGQIDLCRDLARKYELDVVAIYREPDGTGASEKSTAKKRVEYDKMLAAAAAREFEYILAYADDRLTRRPMELEVLINLVQDTGLRIRTHRVEHYDLSSAAGVVNSSIDFDEHPELFPLSDADLANLSVRFDHDDFWCDWNYDRLIAQAEALSFD